MKIGQNDLENLYFLLIIKTYHFFIQFSFKIGFLCFVPSGNVQKKCTLHVPFSFMLNEKGGVDMIEDRGHLKRCCALDLGIAKQMHVRAFQRGTV